MKKFVKLFLCICFFGIVNTEPIFADNSNILNTKKAFSELADQYVPRGIDWGYWTGYDMQIEPPHEDFVHGVVRGMVNTPVKLIKWKCKGWVYGINGDDSGENKEGVFLGNVIGMALIFFIIWRFLIRNRERKIFGWLLLITVGVLEFFV